MDVSVFVVCLLLIRLHIPLWIFLPLPAPLQRSSPARHRIRTHESPRDDGSRKHPQERSITNRSGQQCPCEIAAGGHATSGGLPGAKTQDAWGRTRDRKPHAKTREDAAAMVIEANRELAPPSCSPIFCHRIYQPPPRICPRSGPVRPTTVPWIPPNSL